MNILVVASYPPMPCGIGAYAAQQVEALRAEGHVVDVLCPPGGDGDVQTDLAGSFRFARLLKHAWAYDRVDVHYTPAFFYAPDGGRASRLATRLALLLTAALSRRRVRFIIHETDYDVDRPMEGRGGGRRIDRWTWRLAAGVILHSRRERDAFARRYGLDPAWRRFEIVPQGRYFSPRSGLGRAEARRLLGLPTEKTLFLCIGFIQPHKGFDRLLDALSAVDCPSAWARIVGSVRIAWAPAIEYAQALREKARQDPRFGMIETFVPDDVFDAWIRAADYVVAPYRQIWSSSVVARAALLERPVIASSVGGLTEQDLPPGSFLFSTDAELVEILRRVLAETPAPTPTPA